MGGGGINVHGPETVTRRRLDVAVNPAVYTFLVGS